MPDVATIAGALDSLKTAVDIVSYLRGVKKGYENAEVQLKITELMEKLSDTKQAVLDVKEENLILRKQIADLQLRKSLRSSVRLEGEVYVAKSGEIDGYGSGPWCPKCLDVDEKLVNVHKRMGSYFSTGKGGGLASYEWECPNCRSAFSVE
jgi:hypothetical protein